MTFLLFLFFNSFYLTKSFIIHDIHINHSYCLSQLLLPTSSEYVCSSCQLKQVFWCLRVTISFVVGSDSRNVPPLVLVLLVDGDWLTTIAGAVNRFSAVDLCRLVQLYLASTRLGPPYLFHSPNSLETSLHQHMLVKKASNFFYFIF